LFFFQREVRWKYGDLEQARVRFSDYSRHQRVIEEIASKIAPNNHTVVYFGNCRFRGDNIAQDVKRALVRRIGVEMVLDTPEHRSSQACLCVSSLLLLLLFLMPLSLSSQ